MALARQTVCIRSDVSLDTGTEVALDQGETPVVDPELHFLGVVTVADLHGVEGTARAFSRVEDLTLRNHLVVREESPVREVLATMAHAHLRRLPVVTREGVVVGVVDDLAALRAYTLFSARVTHRER
jgi:CBS domain-containing protein